MTSDCSDKGTTILCNPDQASYVYVYIYTRFALEFKESRQSFCSWNKMDSTVSVNLVVVSMGK